MFKISPAKISVAILALALSSTAINYYGFLPAEAEMIRHTKTTSTASDGKHHWLFPNHPRLRRITKAAGFGVVTGGLAAPLLGMSVAGGAAAGAAEHSAVRGVKDQHDLKKKGKLDHHVW